MTWCSKHPQYRAIRRPRVDCADCRRAYRARRVVADAPYGVLVELLQDRIPYPNTHTIHGRKEPVQQP